MTACLGQFSLIVVRNSISDLNRGIEIDEAVSIELITAEMQFHNASIAVFKISIMGFL